jgi:hypothetical protein
MFASILISTVILGALLTTVATCKYLITVVIDMHATLRALNSDGS